MENFNFSDCRKAVNQVTFRPTSERKAAAMKLLQEALDFVTNLEEVKETKPKAKKRRRKAKRTAAQRTADHMDKQAMRTNEVGPVKPSKKAKTASVKEAKASLKEMDEKKAVKKSASLKAKAVAKGVNEVDKVASLEAKIEALTAVLALHMESSTQPSANEVSLEELPFEL